MKDARWRIGLIGFAFCIAACSSPESEQQEYVKLFLNDPDSAQFRNVKQSKRGPRAWCGEVNAKNRMGGMPGYTRYVLVMPDADLEVDVKKDVDDAKRLAKVSTQDEPGFEGRWSIWCSE